VKNFQLWSFARKIERILHCNKKATILEIGCGNGSLLLTLANIGYSRLSGTDISTAGAKPLSRKGIVFKSANIEKKFPFDKSFDVIILNQVFEHLLDPKFVLARCKEHISEKGKIIIATPNSDSVDIGIFNKYWDGINAPRHFFIFSVRAMESLAKKIGFKKLTIVALPDPGVWAISFQNVLQDIPFLRTRLKNGLAWYTVFLGVLFMPVSLLTACGKMSSSMLAILE
jgi:SAM-dependent methyltransferase